MREIDPHGRAQYDYVGDLDASRKERERQRKHEFAESMGEPAEQTAFELRKAFGERPKGGIFVPRRASE